MTLPLTHTPGVFVTEGKTGPSPGEFVTFETLFITGPSLRGPVANNTQLPVELSDIEQFEALFKGAPGSNVRATILQWFEHGGIGSVYFSRVAGVGALAATADLDDSGGNTVITLTSKGPGADYNFAASPAKGLSALYDATTQILTILDAGIPVENFADVDFNQASRVEDFVNGRSNLVKLTWVDKTKNPITTASAAQLLGGSDGAAVAASDIVGADATKTGVFSFARKTDKLPLGFVCAPGYHQQVVGNALISVAENYRRIALQHNAFGLSLSQLVTDRNLYASPFGKAVYVAGWVKQPDPSQNNALVWFPRVGMRAALISRSHLQENSIANVGAGLQFNARSTVEYEYDFVDDILQSDLNRRGIDLLRDFSSEGQGRVQWSARTISTDVLYRFVNVPITANILAVSIEQSLKQYVFGVINGKDKGLPWAVKTTLEQMLWLVWDSGALFGATPREAFKVEIKGNALLLENGVLPVKVFFKPSVPAERIPVQLLRMQIGYNPVTGEVNIGNLDLAPDSALAA